MKEAISRWSQPASANLWRAGALVVLACIWTLMLVYGRDPLDRSVYEALYAGGYPALVTLAKIFTALGEPTVLITAGVVVALWLGLKGRGRQAAGLILVILIGRGLSEVQKYWIDRPRPGFEPHLVFEKTPSFPSGHSASSMIFYLTLALALAPQGKLRQILTAGAILLSLLIGTSRVLLGVHWPSDVIGGWSFGLLWVMLALRPAERLFGPDSRSPAKQL